MKWLIGYFLAGFVSGFVSLSAWADGSPASGNIRVAPQLRVASDGPVTATFLGASQTATVFGISGSFGYDVSAITETPFARYPLFSNNPSAQQSPTTPPLPAGTNATFATVFTAFIDPGGMPFSTRFASATGGRDTVATAFFEPPGSNVAFVTSLNAGVIEASPDRVLIGFTPSTAMPSGFDGFAVRLSVSNVCVSGS